MFEYLAIDEQVQKITPKTVVLIRASLGDDESCYHARVSAVVGKNVFLTYFHSSSRLLERVLVQGTLSVVVEVFGSAFLGELTPYEPLGTDCALMVELFEEKEQIPAMERLCPMT